MRVCVVLAEITVLLSEQQQLRLQGICRITVAQGDRDVSDQVPLLEVESEHRLFLR